MRVVITTLTAATILSACDLMAEVYNSSLPVTPLSSKDEKAIPYLDRTPTLSGVDANANGVRDDIDKYIASKYTIPAQAKAATQLARSMQSSILVDKTDASAVKAVALSIDRSVNCLHDRFTNTSGELAASAVLHILQSLTANTKTRLIAYLQFSSAMNGTVGTLPEGDTCE